MKKEERLSLKDFIKNTLVDINDAVKEAEEEGVNLVYNELKSGGLSPKPQDISFDLSVTTEQGDESSKGAGLRISVLNGSIDKKSQVGEQKVNRIQFSVTAFLGSKNENTIS